MYKYYITLQTNSMVTYKWWDFKERPKTFVIYYVFKCIHKIDSSIFDGNVEFVHSQYDKIINNSDNLRIKCLSYSKISAILCVPFFVFTLFLFNLRKHVNKCEKISFSLLYLTLVTLCINGSFLCCCTYCTW